MEEIQKKHKRYAVLDGIRGLALLNMISYHGVWDLVYLFGMNWSWYRSDGAFIWQQYICWTFIFLAGMCQPMGRRKLRRALLVFAGGVVISLVTVLVMPGSQVIFGVLTLIGSCTLLMIPLERFLGKCPPRVGLAVSMALFILTRNVNEGYLGFGYWRLCKLPESWYGNWFSTFGGFPMEGFFSTDYFSLIPWMFLFLAGFYTYHLLQRKQWLVHLEKSYLPPLEWLGKHSLIIYMLHQPLIYAVLHIIFLLIR